ncbi:uncharacterized protein [Pseudochaenichthys georgianus]|uniref:uncharacterized protein n=1 Tax=Pseudochaenichthys georgianus TaxID=52239 RepID=UPI00146CC600|nr:uncharacterized protein LOC117446917 [Pseudochaenichthys georgianus]
MEQETISLLAEQQKRNNRQSIKEKMAKAFGYRRQEIVHQRPSIEGLLERWPALFHMEEVNAEFMRITTFPLETKFLAQLDKHSTKLPQVIRSRGGVVKQKTTGILQVLDETVDIAIRRACILKSLMVYLGEPVDHLNKEFQDAEAGNNGNLCHWERGSVSSTQRRQGSHRRIRGPQRLALGCDSFCHALRAHIRTEMPAS